MLAHQELEALCLDRETYHYKQHVALRYAELVYYGQWFTPLREALDGFIDSTQRNVSGKVTMGLCKGNLRMLDRQSPNSLYDTSIGSFVMSPDYNQKDAEGFINILGLPLRLARQGEARAARKTTPQRMQAKRPPAGRKAMKLWGGRFTGRRDPLFEKFSESFSCDQRFILYDLRVNLAYVKELGRAGVLKPREAATLGAGPRSASGATLSGNPNWAQGQSSEDVHTWVEGATRTANPAPWPASSAPAAAGTTWWPRKLRLYVKDATLTCERALAGTARGAARPGAPPLRAW